MSLMLPVSAKIFITTPGKSGHGANVGHVQLQILSSQSAICNLFNRQRR
jgi:hypothetical protein